MKLHIGGPTRDSGPVSFAVDLAQLYAYTREHGPWQDVSVGFMGSTYIHAGREAFLEAVLHQGATHVLWLDTDMSFPPEAAVRLALHNQPVVACNYTTRYVPAQFTAFTEDEDGLITGRVATRAESTGLESVAGVGMGVMLMRTDVTARLSRPWFTHVRNPKTCGDVGEDITFCRALRAAGYSVYIDHDLSKEIGHVGQYTYRIPSAVTVTV